MSKFKVGDKVKIIKDENGWEDTVGKISRVIKVKDSIYPYTLENIESIWCDRELELVKEKEMKKSDLKERWLVKTRNGEEYVIDKDKEDKLQLEQIVSGKVKPFAYEHLYNYNNELNNKVDEGYDIMEVYKPHYDKVWERTEEKKKYTVKELEELTGIKDLEIVK